MVLACAAVAEAKFAQTENFSGRNGVDCGACHTAQLDAASPEARVILTGLPAQWDADQSYPLAIRVEGGPTPLPGRSQAGFDLEVDQGRLSAGAAMDGLLRFPDAQEATYTGNGTLVREWAVVWTAPSAEMQPQETNFWLAGLAANGNHNPQGPEIMGEIGDRDHKVHERIGPSAATLEKWRTAPLPAPTLNARSSYGPYDVHRITGQAPLGAERVEWRVDAGIFASANGTRPFFFDLPKIAPGNHMVEVRALRGDVVSNVTHAVVWIEGAPTPVAQAAAAPPASVLVAVGLLILAKRKL